MRLSVAGFGAVAIAVSALAAPAQAQLLANPVYFSPKAPTGLTLAADFGTTVQTKLDDVTQADKPTNLGVRATLGLPVVTIGAAIGVLDPKGGASKETQIAGDVALKVFSPPLVPLGIALQAGLGYVKLGSGLGAASEYSIPVGLGIALKPPTPGISIEPWVAPRFQLGVTTSGGNRTFRAGLGASAGLNVGLPTGFGLHAALDWSKLAAKTTPSFTFPQTQTIVFGIGLHYTFTIPGLPLVPII
jgi:hypothetical protein